MISIGPDKNNSSGKFYSKQPLLAFSPEQLKARIEVIMRDTNRVNLVPGKDHWGDRVAQTIIERFPTQSLYTCAAGISPSGTVHFGNFRDVVTSLIVARSLRDLGKNVRFLFSWDDFDRFRKVPANVDSSYSQYIGKAISKVPDPRGEFPSYAARFENEFEQAMKQIGIQMEYRCQSKEYTSGRYVDGLLRALNQRHLIADVLLSFMSDKGKAEKQIDSVAFREEFYPINVYSRFSGTDRTKVLGFDGSSKLSYRCLDTQQEETVDLRQDHIAKLAWKIDWPMRWAHEQVVFEPGGKDHAAPGGSYDVSSVLSRVVFDREPPLFLGYEFISLRGLAGKMSSSSGLAVSPSQLLDIYEAPLLLWMYSAKDPNQAFGLAFDSEVFRQYDEFDREVEAWKQGKLNPSAQKAVALSFSFDHPVLEGKPFPFRQAVAMGQIVQWDVDKVLYLLEELGTNYDPISVRSRLGKAQAWLERYNPSEVIRLREEVNTEAADSMSSAQLTNIRALGEFLSSPEISIQELETRVYAIPRDPTLDTKANSPIQRAFFKDVYQLLIGRDTGPRLSTFLWAVDRKKVLRLLSV